MNVFDLFEYNDENPENEGTEKLRFHLKKNRFKSIAKPALHRGHRHGVDEQEVEETASMTKGMKSNHEAFKMQEARKPDVNFDIEDIKRLEQIKDLATLKTQAMALISKPSAKPMRPEKVEWFRSSLEQMNSPVKVIKLMYDLLLSGEGHQVIGSRRSMNPNSYRSRFGEQGVAEGLPQTLRKVVPGYAKREIDKKMDAGKFGKTDADKDANFQRYKKIQDKLKEQGVAEDQLDEIDRRGFLKGLGAAALAGAAGMSAAGDLEDKIGPLPIMATIKIRLPDGTVKTIKKDLGHAYDYRLDDAKKDLEDLLNRKGIKNYSIHLDRYKDNSAYLDRETKPAATADYIDRAPLKGGASNRASDYMDNRPYNSPKGDKTYMDPAESVEEAAKKGLYYYVNKRKKAGTSRPAGHPKAPTAQSWKDAAKTAKNESVADNINEELEEYLLELELAGYEVINEKADRSPGKITKSEDPCWSGYHMVGKKKKNGRMVPNCVPGKKG